MNHITLEACCRGLFPLYWDMTKSTRVISGNAIAMEMDRCMVPTLVFYMKNSGEFGLMTPSMYDLVKSLEKEAEEKK